MDNGEIGASELLPQRHSGCFWCSKPPILEVAMMDSDR
jgi:hypothetical protein